MAGILGHSLTVTYEADLGLVLFWQRFSVCTLLVYLLALLIWISQLKMAGSSVNQSDFFSYK